MTTPTKSAEPELSIDGKAALLIMAFWSGAQELSEVVQKLTNMQRMAKDGERLLSMLDQARGSSCEIDLPRAVSMVCGMDEAASSQACRECLEAGLLKGELPEVC